jgi:hypothetical protein
MPYGSLAIAIQAMMYDRVGIASQHLTGKDMQDVVAATLYYDGQAIQWWRIMSARRAIGLPMTWWPWSWPEPPDWPEL